MRDTKERQYNDYIPNHTLDTIGNPSETCLPPSRPSLASYALEYDRAQRMIRFLSSQMTYCLLGVAGPGLNKLEPQS
jgi:hypothetical protein